MRRGTQPFRADRAARAELAAGGVLVDVDKGQLLLLHLTEEDRWCFPKGHVDPGESVETAALREIAEETGLHDLELEREIGMVVYRFYNPKRDRSVVKLVVYFLVPAKVRPVRPEPIFDQARWVDLGTAEELLEFDSDRDVLALVRKALAPPSGAEMPKHP